MASYDPLEGVNNKTTKDELMDRLRKSAAALRRDDKKQAKRVAEVEERLRSKYQGRSTAQLKQAIFSDTEENWKELVEFLEEFDDLLPIAGQRIVLGGQVLLGLVPVEPEDVQDTPQVGASPTP